MTTHCESCGAAYTDQYARVFGDNEHALHACPDCESSSTVGLGVAAGLDKRRRLASRGGAY